MALAVVEEGIAGKAGKVQEAAGKSGSLGAISRGVARSGLISIDSGACAAK